MVRRGRWSVERRLVFIAVIGRSWNLDLREAQLTAPEVVVTAVSVIGGVNLIVPPGIRVEVDHFGLVGGRNIDTDEIPEPDAPTVRLRAFAIIGGVKVRRTRLMDTKDQAASGARAEGTDVGVGLRGGLPARHAGRHPAGGAERDCGDHGGGRRGLRSPLAPADRGFGHGRRDGRDNLAYLIGWRFGEPATRRFFSSEKSRKRLAWAQRQLDQRGGQLILVARFIPGGRTVVTLSAGLLRFPWRRFFVFDAVAALVWALYAAALGYFGGRAFENAAWKGLLLALGTGFAVGGIVEAVRWALRRRRGQNAPP